MNSMTQILDNMVSVSDFNKGEAGQIFSAVKNSETPKIVLRRNEPECILLSPTKYKELIEELEDLRNLKETKKMSGLSEKYFLQEDLCKELNIAESSVAYSVPEKKILYSINEIRKVLSPILTSYNVKSATLFGSYARGDATEKSDVDILVDSGLKGLKFFGLVNDIAESLRFAADVYDVRELISGSEIEKNIQRDGVLIYGEKD